VSCFVVGFILMWVSQGASTQNKLRRSSSPSSSPSKIDYRGYKFIPFGKKLTTNAIHPRYPKGWKFIPIRDR